MRDFRKLEIWNKGIAIVKSVYGFTVLLPDTEKFGLKSQMQRCAVSIPSNIAEGCSRNSELEYKRFLEIAIGSAFELETQLILCHELQFIRQEKITPLIDELKVIQRQINTLITIISKSHQAQKAKRPKPTAKGQ
jgi:four helix bundle protein